MTEKLKEIQRELDECYTVTMAEKHNCNSVDTSCFVRHQHRMQEAQMRCEGIALKQTKAPPPTELTTTAKNTPPSLTRGIFQAQSLNLVKS